MATVNLNISEKEKAMFDFLVDVNNEIINKQDYFKQNSKYLDEYEKNGKLAALQKIESEFANKGAGK